MSGREKEIKKERYYKARGETREAYSELGGALSPLSKCTPARAGRCQPLKRLWPRSTMARVTKKPGYSWLLRSIYLADKPC